MVSRLRLTDSNHPVPDDLQSTERRTGLSSRRRHGYSLDVRSLAPRWFPHPDGDTCVGICTHGRGLLRLAVESWTRCA